MCDVFGRTGNWFADLSCDELAEMSGSGIDWCSDDLIATAADQTAARGWFEHYHALNALVTADPVVLSAVVAAVQSAAAPQPCRAARSILIDRCHSNTMNTASDTLLDRRRIGMPRRIHARSAGLCIHSFETALDLANLTMTSTSITAVALAEASGLTVAEITLTDEPRYQRTRGHP